ncbi:hypothetical protein HDU81_007802 [Chytriomyces hyalinus]|nr:hypothetical protein HDU81_007802 [Chytriomyces hyalinus]
MRRAARASNSVTQHESPSVDLARDSLHTLMDEAFGGKTLAHVVTREDLFVHGRYDVDYQDPDAQQEYGPHDLYTPYCPTSQSPLSDCSSEIDALFDDVMDDLDIEIELACRELELARVSDLSFGHCDDPTSMLDNARQSELSSSPAYIPQSPCSTTFSFDNYICSTPQQLGISKHTSSTV